MSKNLKYLFFVTLVLLLTNLTFAAIEDERVMPYDQQVPGGTTPIPGGTTPRAIPLPNPLGTESIIQVINNVLNYLIYISVPILALMVLWGGFQILSARGNPQKVQSGGKTIMWGVIGFTIILASKGVALILLTLLGG